MFFVNLIGLCIGNVFLIAYPYTFKFPILMAIVPRSHGVKIAFHMSFGGRRKNVWRSFEEVWKVVFTRLSLTLSAL